MPVHTSLKRLTAALAPVVIMLCASGCRDEPKPPEPTRRLEPTLRVMTFNIAHGRRLQLFQITLPRRQFEENVAAVAAVIQRARPQVVALQEADGPSVWSGGFDHVERLAKLAGFGHWFRAEHISPNLGPLKGSYGTALMSAFPITEPQSHVFPFMRGHYRKGFAAAVVEWPRLTEGVDVVSAHLDSADPAVRRAQAEEMVSVLRQRSRPLIVMGDFNCRWATGEETLRFLCRELDLTPYTPDAERMETFPSTKPRIRIDWILASPEFEFVSYEVLADVASDHLAVVAELRLKH